MYVHLSIYIRINSSFISLIFSFIYVPMYLFIYLSTDVIYLIIYLIMDHGVPTFLRSKRKKGRQREKRKDFKAETMKRLSPRSKCYCFSHSRAFRIRKFSLSTNDGGRQYFSVFHAPAPSPFEIHFTDPVH